MAVPRFCRVVEAGAHLQVDFPWAIDDPAGFREAMGLDEIDSVRWWLELGDTVVATDVLGPARRIEVDLEGKRSGAYRLRLTAHKRELWRQHIYCQPRLSRTPEQIDVLARKYAPVLLFSSKEEYFPVSLGTLIEAPAVKSSDDNIEVETVHGDLEVPLRELSEFLRYNGHSDYLLNQSAFDAEKVFDEVRGDFRRSVVYYSWLEHEDSGRAFLNYHTFYAFDPKTGIAKFLGIGPHVFDRESLTVVFGPHREPESLVLSGHLEGQRILFFDSLKSWTNGRVRMPFPDDRIAAVCGHPVVPVAEGSHAFYPAPGLYHISVLTELAGHVFASLVSWLGIEHPAEEVLADHQVLLPPSLQSRRFASYTLRPMRIDLLRSEPLPEGPLYDPGSAALTFSGYWVDVPGFQNERFPPYSSREIDPAAWVDGAHPWHWEELPEMVVAHNRQLAGLIASEVEPR
jgi:hypothetical protein